MVTVILQSDSFKTNTIVENDRIKGCISLAYVDAEIKKIGSNLMTVRESNTQIAHHFRTIPENPQWSTHYQLVVKKDTTYCELP